MISLLMCIKEKKEKENILSNVKSIVAMFTDEELNCIHFDKRKTLEKNLEGTTRIQAAIVDITSEDGLELVANIRGMSSDIEIMIIADMTISPIKYLNPMIKASALLLRPLEKTVTFETIKSFVKQFCVQQTSEETEAIFCLKRRGEEVSIPYASILYLEARNKKLFIRSGAKEYVVYETLESIQDSFPDYFIRCHRSFLINRKHIENIKYSEGYIYLDNEEIIPLSRGYKATVKGVLSGERDLR